MQYTVFAAARKAMDELNRRCGHPPAAVYFHDVAGEEYWTVISAWGHYDRGDLILVLSPHVPASPYGCE